ncbi:putative protein N(5)-glutamine methyltransferase [Streptomyces albidoflavus]|uniref:Methyltransferase domain-containing protein n=1 Tax=Streptomyces albidoflavus TaxID=1886 RepID=A0A8G1ZUK3_9ACTN|nr:putative protein N(5)-glutamine methyltransferase [Streptomyces albidoflavus]KUL67712.1 SAM-dependent methyltransferase [Streptomyces albidoflavus]RZE26046.1 putative protein N(5)-glutamine methyltransferase [Streptomyces albidoflavus]WSU14935.1 putative protein N(5)-glutamine methyltransferase [Streptomyces albidoflavus]
MSPSSGTSSSPGADARVQPADVPPSAVAAATVRLRAAGCVFAEEEAALLAEAAASGGGDGLAALDRLVARRAAGHPLEHVVGWAEFAGLRIAVGPGVFVPRRRTEFLLALARDLLARARGPVPVAVDLCCGSGAAAAALAASGRRAEVHAADIDPVAAGWARRNLAGVGEVHEGDLYAALPAALRGRVAVLVANVPYVPTADLPLLPAEARTHEPRVALDGGDDGLAVLRRVAAEAGRWLAPGGTLLVETTGRQARTAREVLAAAGLTPALHHDEERAATVLTGARPA